MLLSTLAALALTAQGPPATDIFVAELQLGTGAPRVGAPRNATRRSGYDNQPAFLGNGRDFLYTSIREDAQADIYRYDFAADSGLRVTTTPESEYSAAPLAGGSFIVVRVERDSTQRLWRFDRDGNARLMLERVKPVGYFAFGDDHTVGVFVLGQPATFQVADTRTGQTDTLAQDIGRTIQKIPGKRAISFVRRASETEWWITAYDLDTRALTPIVRTLDGVDFYAWTPSGMLLAAKGSVLYSWTSGADWVPVADLATAGLSNITRVAINATGDRIALVALPTTGDSR